MQDFFIYGKLKEQFTQVFGDIDAKQMMEQEWFYLKQTKSATAYAAEFQQIATNIEWENEALTAKYYKDLKYSVKNKIVKANQPNELDKMIEKSIIIDNRQYKRQLKWEDKPNQWSFAD